MRAAALTCVLAIALAGSALAREPSSVPTDASPCSRDATRAALRSFFAAFDAGDGAKLESLFAPEPAFQWYSTPGPGERIGPRAKRRDTLIPYLRRRHAKGDRLALGAFHWSGNSPHWSNFWFEGRRRTPGFEAGRWFEADGKGAAVCDGGAAQIIVLTFGEPAAAG